MTAGVATTLFWEYILMRPLGIAGATVGLIANFTVFALCTRRYRRRRQLLRLQAK